MSMKNVLLLVLLAALWGASYPFMRVATPEFGPFALIEIRVLIACAVLVPIWFTRASPNERSVVAKNWRGLLFVGMLNSTIPFVLFAWSTLHITGGFASILNSTAPVWTALVAWAWLQRRPSSNTFYGLGVGLFGVAVLVSDSVSWAQNSVGLGVLAATFGAFLYGVAANYTAERLHGLSTLSIATFSLVAAVILLSPFAWAFYPAVEVSSTAWLIVIFMGVFSTALANIIYFYLLANVGPTQAVSVTFLIPVFGTLWGVLFIQEDVTMTMLVGGAIILFGTALVTGILKLARTTTAGPQ